MSFLLWLVVFFFSVTLLVKSSAWVVRGASRVGAYFRLPPFIIGIVLVGLGTSLPELSSSLAAVFQHKGGIVPANIIGSNIVNILLVIGVAALINHRLIVKKKIATVDVSLLLGATAVFFFMAIDGKISSVEGIILFLLSLGYLFYNLFQKDKKALLDKKERKLKAIDIFQLVFGLAGLILGANYTITSLTHLALALKIPETLIAATALALGTSLPELVVSIKAALAKKIELSLGNIFGSNIFNLLLIGGLPAMIYPLAIDPMMMKIGLPFLGIATVLFSFSCWARKIYFWEGFVYLSLYLLFLGKISRLF